MGRFLISIGIGCWLFAGSVAAGSSEQAKTGHEIHLSPGTLELLRSEMREIAAGMQTIPVSLASGDWHAIHEAGVQIKNSYILKQSLTAEQLEELKSALPAGFKRLDGEFHGRAGDLAEAAKRRDVESVAFEYSRMLENCASCHSAYASERFPGFAKEPVGHQH